MDVYFDGGTRAQDSPGPLTLIRDDARNIDYIINRQLNNCTVLPRDQDKKFFYSFDADSFLVAQLATPPQLITLARLFPYAYEGVTNVRGVDVDAWIGTLPLFPYQFSNPGLVGLLNVINPTFQVFFTRPGWRITSDRAVSTEPVLWRITVSAYFAYTNATDNATANGFSTGFFDIFDFSPEEPDFDVFDVSACFSPSEYHVLSLAVPGHEQGLNFSQLRQNLRSAIVNYSDIQPLQVGNIQVGWQHVSHAVADGRTGLA